MEKRGEVSGLSQAVRLLGFVAACIAISYVFVYGPNFLDRPTWLLISGEQRFTDILDATPDMLVAEAADGTKQYWANNTWSNTPPEFESFFSNLKIQKSETCAVFSDVSPSPPQSQLEQKQCWLMTYLLSPHGGKVVYFMLSSDGSLFIWEEVWEAGFHGMEPLIGPIVVTSLGLMGGVLNFVLNRQKPWLLLLNQPLFIVFVVIAVGAVMVPWLVVRASLPPDYSVYSILLLVCGLPLGGLGLGALAFYFVRFR